MGTWNSRGLRGSTLEDMINYTNTRYEEMGLALIQKVPTPITPVRIDKERRHITLAYLTRSAPWIISELFREFPFVLTQKSVPQIHFRFRMFTSIRFLLWRSMKNSRGFLF